MWDLGLDIELMGNTASGLSWSLQFREEMGNKHLQNKM